MGTEPMLIGISAAVLLSYWFSHLGRQLRFPAVIFLIATGIVLRDLTDFRGATLNFFGGGLAVLVMGSLIGLAVYWLVGHLRGHVKFLPLIFALILVYAGAKAMHLSPLLIVLILGLMLNNPHLLRHVRWLDRLHSDHYGAELDKLKHLTAEATFLVRTFFFLLLGYSTDLDTLADPLTWGVAVALVVAIFGLRWPLFWASPRGLITVLLFYSLPAGVVPPQFPEGALVLVVLLSCAVMAIGLQRDAARSAPVATEPGRPHAPGDTPPVAPDLTPTRPGA